MSRHRRTAPDLRSLLTRGLGRAATRARLLVSALLVAVCTALLLAPATSGAYTASIRNSNNTVGSAAAFFTCDSAYAADRAAALYSFTLAQPSGATTAPDTDSGAYPGTYRGAMVSSATTPKACPRDAGGSWQLNGSTNYLSTSLSLSNPTTFSTEIWFKTTVAGGKLFSFSPGVEVASTQYDRHTYIGANGRLMFGIYNGGVQSITSPGVVNDGAWHHVVSTLSPTAGMSLWLDGAQVATNTTYRTPENTTGYWKIGHDTLGGSWTNVGPTYFSGSLRYAAVYNAVLTPTQIQNHYSAGR